MRSSTSVDAAPRTVPYARRYFYQRTMVLLTVFSFLLLILVVQAGTPAGWLSLAAGVLVAYVVVVGLSPMLTSHTLTRSRIILRQGWYFRCIVALGDAEAIGPYDGDPKFGLRLVPSRDILFVVGGRRNLVSLRLREPRRFPQVLFLTAKEIVFDVDDREAFLAAIVDRRASGKPLPARKVPLLPAAARR